MLYQLSKDMYGLVMLISELLYQGGKTVPEMKEVLE